MEVKRTKTRKKVQVVVIASSNDQLKKSILLLKTNQARGGFWQNITGGVDAGEDYIEAAKRELTEETGLTNLSVRELDISFNFHDQWGFNVTEKVFYAEVPHTCEVELDSSEHSDYKWVLESDISTNLLKYTSNFEAIQKCLKVL